MIFGNDICSTNSFMPVDLRQQLVKKSNGDIKYWKEWICKMCWYSFDDNV